MLSARLMVISYLTTFDNSQMEYLRICVYKRHSTRKTWTAYLQNSKRSTALVMVPPTNGAKV